MGYLFIFSFRKRNNISFRPKGTKRGFITYWMQLESDHPKHFWSNDDSCSHSRETSFRLHCKYLRKTFVMPWLPFKSDFIFNSFMFYSIVESCMKPFTGIIKNVLFIAVFSFMNQDAISGNSITPAIITYKGITVVSQEVTSCFAT